MTVKELSSYLKLSEMMIYKLAQRGEIPAAKVGSAWRFSQDEIDRWLLRGTRTSSEIAGPAGEALSDFIRAVKEEYKEHFVTAILFGSYARGDAHPDSDIDILIVLKDVDDLWTADSRISDLAYENTFDKGRSFVMAPIVMEERKFLTGGSPFLLNIRREGVKAA